MNRQEYLGFVEDFYGIKYDCPFEDELNALVFRHPDNRKWFALVMTIKKSCLGIEKGGYIDVVNLKCAPEIIDDLWHEAGIYPAYHMNKSHWLTLALDGSCSDEALKWVTGISFELTKKKIKKQKEIHN